MATEPIDLVIFDCDGVLVDSERLGVRVDVEVLNEAGWPITRDEVIERFMGRTTEHFLATAEEHLGRRLGSEWLDMVKRRYFAAFDAELQTVDGVVEALDAIDIPVCVASGGSHEKLGRTLRKTGLFEQLHPHIFSAEEVANGKPAPDLFLYAAEQMGVAPARCVVIEDSKYGLQAARAADMRAVGFSGGLTPVAWLLAEDAVVLDDMRQLPTLLEVMAR